MIYLITLLGICGPRRRSLPSGLHLTMRSPAWRCSHPATATEPLADFTSDLEECSFLCFQDLVKPSPGDGRQKATASLARRCDGSQGSVDIWRKRPLGVTMAIWRSAPWLRFRSPARLPRGSHEDQDPCRTCGLEEGRHLWTRERECRCSGQPRRGRWDAVSPPFLSQRSHNEENAQKQS